MKFDFMNSICIVFSCFLNHLIMNNLWVSLLEAATDDDLVVEIKQGKLRGRRFESIWNKTTYYGFLGIPYAKPPIKNLRFQAPQSPDHWQGVFSATHERDQCQDFPPFQMQRGSEDCLYLNVYTLQPPKRMNSRKAVMVFIHGGGFLIGSGSRTMYGADYLILHDIILVTINYRLGVLGFLNLGLPECPGNAGLKDQVLALKWVRENIAKFGGDPDNVTIFGESAGATSVHYLLLSPMAKGLYKRAIIESGSALSPWGMNYNPIELAFHVGKYCGYSGNDTRELLQHLRTKTSPMLALAGAELALSYKKSIPGKLTCIGPSVEVIKKGAFLPDYPENLAKTATPVPVIYGVNNKEGILFFMLMQDVHLPLFREDFSVIIRNNFNVDPRSLPRISAQIKQRYFGDKNIGKDNANSLVDLFSDIYFYYADKAIEFLTKSKIPPYVYEFAHHGLFNVITQFINMREMINIKGAAHGDEIMYLFRPSSLPFFLQQDPASRRITEKMTLMWTNFAKRGNPNPTGDVEWRRSTRNMPCYLQIKDRSRMMLGRFFENRHEFLSRLIDPVMKPGSKAYET